MLAALARVATRRPMTVIFAWLVLLVLGFGLGTGVFERLDDAVSSIPGSETEQAAERLDGLDPAGDSLTAVIVAPAVDDPALRSGVAAAVADLAAIPGVTQVPDPYTTPGLAAEDGEALLLPVGFDAALDDGAEEDAVATAADRIRELDGLADAEVQVSGDALLGDQIGERAQGDVARAEIISLPLVLLLLIVVFGGLRAAGLPLVVAVSGIAGAFLALFLFSLVTDVSVYAVQVTTMLGLGLAVDYALLLVVRYREERAAAGDGEDHLEAVRRTVVRAGRTVLFSGLTVAVSLAGLLVFPNPFLRSMGLAVAAVVAVDMLAAVTLLPALLARFGRRITPAPATTRSGREPGHLFARLARFSARRPLAVAVTVVAGLVVLAVPAAGTTIELGDARQLPTDTEARKLYDALAEHYPEGTGVRPVEVLAGPGTDPALLDRLPELPGVARAESRELPDGTLLVELTPTGSVDGPAATALVEQVRELRGAEPVEVTGNAAALVDFRAMLADRAPWAVATVLVSVFLLLFAFTGSLLIPLRTIATTLLSLGAALGVVTWVFQDGNLVWLIGAEEMGALSLTGPPLIIAISFGLAMDYELFILARMRETWLDTGDEREAVVAGLQRSGRVVSCAALLLAVVFAAFMTGGFSPILQIGLGLTLAVLIDASVVRMLLVPATMSLLGRRAWWSPAPLRRLHHRYGLHEEPRPAPPEKISLPG
ncbi:MMPL family transporter [Streptomyces aidingensis]|uniref:Putative drug exporter of the RND superfamily n=1 Tax=Streptomyces aidingensis TaxID=910347 RepID=A0A1I1UZX9_9ACTN|nr:MMPL family transporter [Streptomyces aidingensis]SFD76189.1 putative drug exporter of the RND superfamily [Streptomyces aidingensis]